MSNYGTASLLLKHIAMGLRLLHLAEIPKANTPAQDIGFLHYYMIFATNDKIYKKHNTYMFSNGIFCM